MMCLREKDFAGTFRYAAIQKSGQREIDERTFFPGKRSETPRSRSRLGCSSVSRMAVIQPVNTSSNAAGPAPWAVRQQDVAVDPKGVFLSGS
jgi:hypothetical protein